MYHPIYHMDSKPTLFNFATPKGDHLEPPPSSHSIETSSYELRPGFIAMVREKASPERRMKVLIPTCASSNNFVRVL
jgi:hypothetical protein